MIRELVKKLAAVDKAVNGSFDNVNTAYTVMLEQLDETEGELARQVFTDMLKTIYKESALVAWDWQKNTAVFTLAGRVQCRTYAKELPDGNTEISTEVMGMA